jgi:hypothetical protein
MHALRPILGLLKPFPIGLAMLIAASEIRAESAPRAAESESSDADTVGRFYAGAGIHLSQSVLRYPRYMYTTQDHVRSYPNPGMSLSLDVEFQTKRFLLGLSLHLGSWVQGTEPPLLLSLHPWAAWFLGRGEIAPYIGGGFGALAMGQDEKTKLGPVANATVGVMFFRSRRYLRPELTLQIFLPLFDTSDALFSARAPAFWPVALLGVRLLI